MFLSHMYNYARVQHFVMEKKYIPLEKGR